MTQGIQSRGCAGPPHRGPLGGVLAIAAIALLAACVGRSLAATDIAITPQYFAEARAVARNRCKPDAVLTQVTVRTDDRGVAHLAQDPGAIAMTFVSPSTPNFMCLVAATPEGELGAMPMPMAPQTTTPLPDSFLDLASAIAKARAQGFAGSPIQAMLQMTPRPFGGAPSAAWTFMAVNPGGVVTRMVSIDAGSGVNVTASQTQTEDELKRGIMLPPNESGDYRAMRREADALATRLNSAMRIARIDLIGRASGGGFIVRQARFIYVAPRVDFEIPVLEVDGSENSLKAKYNAMNPTAAWLPTALPSGPIDLEQALPQLLALAPNANRSDLLLQLEQIKGPGDIYNGPFDVQAVSTGATTASAGAYLPTERPDLYGHAVWRLLTVTYGPLPGEGIASHSYGKRQDYVYVDALTARALSPGGSGAPPPMSGDMFPKPGKVMLRPYGGGASGYPGGISPGQIQ